VLDEGCAGAREDGACGEGYRGGDVAEGERVRLRLVQSGLWR
jgi:hypothetical protein